MPSRLACGDSCDCLVVDPQFFDDIRGNVTTDTMVFGTGAEDNPFYFQNVHHPNFIPPSAIVRTSAPVPIPIPAEQFISFDIEDLDTFEMFNPAIDNTSIFIPISGYYLFGIIAVWNPTPGQFIRPYNMDVVATDPSGFSITVFNISGYDENPNATTQRNTGRTDATISSPFAGAFNEYLFSGWRLRARVDNTENPGLQSVTLWTCWI
jgi:hypothetical protein